MLTSKDFAAKLNVDPARVRRLCIDGRIKGAVKFGPNWMIPPEAKVKKVPMGRPKSK